MRLRRSRRTSRRPPRDLRRRRRVGADPVAGRTAPDRGPRLAEWRFLPQRDVRDRIRFGRSDPRTSHRLNRFALPTKLFEFVALELPVVAAGLPTMREHFSDRELRFSPSWATPRAWRTRCSRSRPTRPQRQSGHGLLSGATSPIHGRSTTAGTWISCRGEDHQPELAHGIACELRMNPLFEKAARTARENGYRQLFARLCGTRSSRCSRGRPAGRSINVGLTTTRTSTTRPTSSRASTTGGSRFRPGTSRSRSANLQRGLLAADPPRTVLEIGTAGGGTLFLLRGRPRRMRSWSRSTSGTDASAAATRPGAVASIARSRVPANGSRWSGRLARAADQGANPPAARRQARRSALHRRRPRHAGVKRDFADYTPLVRPGGVVAFHDIVPSREGGHGDPGGVPAFWQKLKKAYPDAAELVADWSWGSCGIGVIRWNPTAHPDAASAFGHGPRP